jgi:ATP-dependent DNA ligase
VVAIDDSGRPDFNLLQNFRAEASRIHYYVFDLLCWKDRDLTCLPVMERRALLKTLLVVRDKRIGIADYVEAAPKDLLAAVRDQGLEGIIGKRKDSYYQPGKRSGAWIKYRMNRAQEFVIGGYFPGPHGFDSLIVGYYDGDQLMYVARTHNRFVPASRRQVFSKLKHLVTPACPFANLPEARRSRLGEELNAEKMKKAVWLRPEAVAQIEFLEWTEADRLRHSKFVGLREDKDPRSGQGANRRLLNNFRLARHSGGTVIGITRPIRRRSTIRPMEEATIPTDLIGETRTPAAACEWTVNAPLLPNLLHPSAEISCAATTKA